MSVSDAEHFYSSVLGALAQQIAVIDARGSIRWVNDAWKTFSGENGGHPGSTWEAANYLDVCSRSAENGDDDAAEALAGIGDVMRGRVPDFYFEYPCHSPLENRWFLMRILPLEKYGPTHFVVTHENITQRKEAELRLAEMAVLDGLTGIANRRRFDEFLEEEWRRAMRLGHPVSLILFDIDFFKPYNDNYGHTAGDDCLRKVGRALLPFSRRPDDLVARYGGEEFAVILGNTAAQPAGAIADDIRAAVQALGIAHDFATAAGCVTISAGVATRNPGARDTASPVTLIEAADKALYAAKQGGRNRVRVLDGPPDGAPA